MKALQIPAGSAAARDYARLIRRANWLLELIPPVIPLAAVTISLARRDLAAAARIEAERRITRFIRARRGVLLSAGGFILNQAMVEHYAPLYRRGLPNGTLGDIGIHIKAHSPWIPPENVRHSFAWIKGAAGPAAQMQVDKFTEALVGDLEDAGVKDRPLGVDFIDITMMRTFERAGITWTDGMTPMMEARAIKSPDEIKAFSIVGAICDYVHYEITNFIKPGLTENEVAAFGFERLYSLPGMEDVEDVIVSSGPNAWPNWRNFSDWMIRPGELVIVDLAALTWNGFKSCVYRTYCVGGKPTDEHQQTYDLAHKWLWDSIEATKPGVTTADVASKWPSAKEVWGYEEEDQAAANFWGHGLGLAQYDPPVISRIWSLDHPVEIQPGMTFALETQHGKLHDHGVRLEEMLYVTETGIEMVSSYASHEIISVT